MARRDERAQAKDDPRLLEACRRGDRAALSEVFAANAAAIERLLLRLVGPGADAEDLLQGTFLAAIGAFPRFRGEAAVRTWLLRIAVHVAHEHLRRPERKRRVPLELVRDASEPVDPAPSPERAAEARRLLGRVYEHLAALPPRRRIAFILHVLEGRPIDEVAALVGASGLATRSRIFWARRALMKRLRRDPAFRPPRDGEEGGR